MGKIIKRKPRQPTGKQLGSDKGRLIQRTVRNKETGVSHRQGVMYGTKYGFRAGVARIGSKKVGYTSRRKEGRM